MNNQGVFFNAGGQIRDDATENNQGFDSVPSDGKSEMQGYAIAPVFWLFVLLIGGYLGLRYIMED